jgi:hypothetical protein
MHGPTVRDADDRRRHKTYLIALLDDATRIIPAAAFTRSETVAAFLPVLERAIRRRGLPKRLYVDNGSAYRARHLALVCAKLGVTLIHARPLPAPSEGEAGALVSDRPDPAPPDAHRGRHAGPRGAQSPAVGLDRRGVSLRAASRPGRRDAGRPLGRGLRAHPAPHQRSQRRLPLRGETQGPAGPHRQPPRRGLRGGRGARRRDRHAPLRPRPRGPRRPGGRFRDARSTPPSPSMPTPTASCAATTRPSASPRDAGASAPAGAAAAQTR